MKELSLNILDIAQNSVKAGADKIEIALAETAETLSIRISDNGCGMSDDFVRKVMDPFCTTRTTRSVGMGIPLFKLAAEQTGGELKISSATREENPHNCGTVIEGIFNKNHIDYTELGDVVSTVVTLIQGQPDINWVFSHETEGGCVRADTEELKSVLGDVPINSFEVICWIKEYLQEQYTEYGYN